MLLISISALCQSRNYDTYNNQIIKENPFKIREIKNTKHYHYEGTAKDESIGAEVLLSYGTQSGIAGENSLGGILNLNGTPFVLLGKYKGKGKYEAVLYKKSRFEMNAFVVRGTVIWNNYNPNNVYLKITDENFPIDFIMQKICE